MEENLEDEAAQGAAAVSLALLNQTRGRVLVNGLLPRGDQRTLARLCPPTSGAQGGWEAAWGRGTHWDLWAKTSGATRGQERGPLPTTE